jgi:hypothetical protein
MSGETKSGEKYNASPEICLQYVRESCARLYNADKAYLSKKFLQAENYVASTKYPDIQDEGSLGEYLTMLTRDIATLFVYEESLLPDIFIAICEKIEGGIGQLKDERRLIGLIATRLRDSVSSEIRERLLQQGEVSASVFTEGQDNQKFVESTSHIPRVASV